jgi:hypothetical protein
MRYATATWFGAALALTLVGTTNARAEFIPWTYSWLNSPAQVLADSPGTGMITLTNENTRDAIGTSDIVATNIHAVSTAPSDHPDVFTAKPYSLGLTLTDKDSGASGSLTFTGQFSGTLTANNSLIKNTFTGQTTQSVVLGDHLYTATIGQYVPPGPTGAVNAGSISAHATVEVSSVIQVTPTPEPSTLALWSVSLPFLGVSLWRRAKTRRAGTGA